MMPPSENTFEPLAKLWLCHPERRGRISIYGYRGLDKPWGFRGAWSWGLTGSATVHALIVAAVLVAFHDRPMQPRMVVPVETVA